MVKVLLRAVALAATIVACVCMPAVGQETPASTAGGDGASITLPGSGAQVRLAASGEPVKMDITKALEVAFRNNPDIRIALDDIRKARGQEAEAFANFMPKFNVKIDQIQQGPEVSFENPGVPGAMIDLVQPHNTTADGTVFLPIDINKKYSFIGDLAKYSFLINYQNLVTASEKLIFQVKQGYFEYLRAMGNQDVAQKAVDVAKAQLKDTQARYGAGTAPKFDVTRAEVSVANLTQTLISATNRVELARTTFNRTLGIDVTTLTDIEPVEIKIERKEFDIPKMIDYAYANRPEIKAASLGIDAAKKNVRLQRTGILPSMGINGIYNYNFKASGFSSENASWIATATLNIPIWDGGITKAKVEQAHAESQKTQDQFANVKLLVSTEVQGATLNLLEGIEKVQTTEENVKLAEETLRLARVRYEAGISLLVEVTDSESALTLARFNYVAAKYDYAIGLAQLERATATQPEVANLQLLK